MAQGSLLGRLVQLKRGLGMPGRRPVALPEPWSAGTAAENVFQLYQAPSSSLLRWEGARVG